MSTSEMNGNVVEGFSHNTSSSTEDLSEYTDADESISAPTELLAEFLSSIMLKNYEKALQYCTLILNYEPNNSTAKEFYPLIMEKLEMIRSEEYDDSSSESADSWSLNSSTSESENEQKRLTDSDATSASYSSLEDDEAEKDNNAMVTSSEYLSTVDLTNGNTNNIDSNISTNASLKAENTIIPLTDQNVEETKSIETEKPSSPKILVRPTPTITLNEDTSFQLQRTQTYTKSLSCQNQMNLKITSQTPMKTNKSSKTNNLKISKKKVFANNLNNLIEQKPKEKSPSKRKP